LSTYQLEKFDIMELPPSYDDARHMAPAEKYMRPQRQEIKLHESTEERDKYFELAVLYSIIKATETLEKIYATGELSYSDYKAECDELIGHFNRSKKYLLSRGFISSIELFMQDYEIVCPRAYSRLAEEGNPVEKDDRGAVVVVADTVQAFINAKDVLDLNERAVDKVQPYIQDLLISLRRMLSFGLPADFIGIVKIEGWLNLINEMKAHEDISVDSCRQLTFDLEKSYNEFKAHLSSHGRS